MLPFRVLRHNRLQGGDGIIDQASGKQQLGPAFSGHHAQLVQPDRRGQREWPVSELTNRRATPQGQCLVEEPESLFCAHLSRFGQGVLEPGGVELASLEGEAVAPLQCDEVAACWAEGAAQAGDLRPQRRARFSGQRRPISARSAAVMGGQRGSDGVVSGDTDLGDLRQVIEGLTGASLDGHTEPVEGPGWPQPRSYPVRECLLCILNEEWEHRLYAERDLDALEARSA